MLTTHETRVLYILRKLGNRAKHSQISQAMHRVKAPDRQQALATCEALELISSARVPPTKGQPSSRGGGPGGLVYWLTQAGADYVQDLIDSGAMRDPDKEPRAGKGGARASA